MPQEGAERPFPYLLVTLLLALTIERDLTPFLSHGWFSGRHQPRSCTYPTRTPHARQRTHSHAAGQRVTGRDLSQNNRIAHPAKSLAMIKGSATAHTLGPQGPRMKVAEATTHLRVIQSTNPYDTGLPRGYSHTWPICRCASPATKALSLSHQSFAYYLTGVLNASIGFQALHLTHPSTALQPATRAVTKAWAPQGGYVPPYPLEPSVRHGPTMVL